MDRRFGRAGENGIDAFAAAYGWDIRAWPGLDTLIAIREIWGLRPYIRTARDRPATASNSPSACHTLQSGDTRHDGTWRSLLDDRVRVPRHATGPSRPGTPSSVATASRDQHGRSVPARGRSHVLQALRPTPP